MILLKWLGDDEEDVCQSFIRAYPIPNGTAASTMWCSRPNGGGKRFSGKHVVNWDRFSTGWRGRKNARFSKGI
jgi:hypothetical protein